VAKGGGFVPGVFLDLIMCTVALLLIVNCNCGRSAFCWNCKVPWFHLQALDFAAFIAPSIIALNAWSLAPMRYPVGERINAINSVLLRCSHAAWNSVCVIHRLGRERKAKSKRFGHDVSESSMGILAKVWR